MWAGGGRTAPARRAVPRGSALRRVRPLQCGNFTCKSVHFGAFWRRKDTPTPVFLLVGDGLMPPTRINASGCDLHLYLLIAESLVRMDSVGGSDSAAGPSDACVLRDETNFIQNVSQFYNMEGLSDVILVVGQWWFTLQNVMHFRVCESIPQVRIFGQCKPIIYFLCACFKLVILCWQVASKVIN